MVDVFSNILSYVCCCVMFIRFLVQGNQNRKGHKCVSVGRQLIFQCTQSTYVYDLFKKDDMEFLLFLIYILY